MVGFDEDAGEDRRQLIRLMNRLCPRTHVSLLFEESLAGLSRLSLTPVQVDLNKDARIGCCWTRNPIRCDSMRIVSYEHLVVHWWVC